MKWDEHFRQACIETTKMDMKVGVFFGGDVVQKEKEKMRGIGPVRPARAVWPVIKCITYSRIYQ
jgi:hypothetical protein